MIFYGSPPKSKKKKPPKAVREQYDQWLLQHSPKKVKPVNTTGWSYKLSTPAGRDTVRHPSLDTGLGVATKPAPKVYTGSMVKGIATMHKSNAVPVFTDEQAVDISRMRR